MMFMSLLMTLTFTSFTQPLPMGLLLVAQTLLLGYMSFSLTKMSWYSFILMITMAGALLVTFIYISVLTPTEPLARRSFGTIPLMLTPTLIYIMNPTTITLKPPLNLLPSPLFSTGTLPLTLFLTTLLLICLLIIVHNTFTMKGPMRSY